MKMQEIIKVLKLLVSVFVCITLVIIAFIVIIIVLRKSIESWKSLLIILCIVLCLVLVYYSLYLRPFFLDFGDCEIIRYDTAIVNKVYYNSNIITLVEMELSLPNGETVWIKSRKSFDVGTEVYQLAITKHAYLLIDYKIDENHEMPRASDER